MTDDHAAHAIGAYGSTGQPDAAPRSARARGRAADQRLCHQRDLHAEPGRDPDRPVLALNGVTMFNRFDSSRDDGRAAAAAGRLSHRHGRQVAPRQRSGRLRPLGDPPRPGRLSRSRSSTRRPARRPIRAGTPPTSSPIWRSSSSSERPRDKPFFLMMHHKAPHRPWEPADAHAAHFAGAADSRAGDVLGFVRHAHRRAAREPAARRRRPDEPRPEADAARRAGRRRADEVADDEARLGDDRARRQRA